MPSAHLEGLTKAKVDFVVLYSAPGCFVLLATHCEALSAKAAKMVPSLYNFDSADRKKERRNNRTSSACASVEAAAKPAARRACYQHP